jgi:hypothetical protein
VPTITVVCNEFRRPHLLDRQLEMIVQQTVPASEILVWHNHPEKIIPGVHSNVRFATHVFAADKVSRHAKASVNFGTWARFAFALNATSEYVAVFDDDAIPGVRWFENCLATMGEGEALLGTAGFVHDRDGVSWDRRGVGCYARNNERLERVDYVEHAWFFKRAWLSTFWRELPPDPTLGGEGMHFSFMLQRYLAIPTVVPEHPSADRSLWGGSTSGALDRDGAMAIERTAVRERMFDRQRARGWRLVSE